MSQGSWYRAQFLPDLARPCREIGDIALGEELLEAVPDASPGYRLALASARAVLAGARGDLEDAVLRYLQAAEGLQGFGWVVEQAQCRLGAGRTLLALGRSGEAIHELSGAREVFLKLGPIRRCRRPTACWTARPRLSS